MTDELLEQPARDGFYHFWGVRYFPGEALDEMGRVTVYDGDKTVMTTVFNLRVPGLNAIPPWAGPYVSKEPLRIEMPDGLTARWSKEGGLDLYG